jgi:hypothetical protein
LYARDERERERERERVGGAEGVSRVRDSGPCEAGCNRV